MFLKKTEIISSAVPCGMILKPFDESWYFQPNGGLWIHIMLTYCNYDNEKKAFYLDGYTDFEQVPRFGDAKEIVGKALLINVNFSTAPVSSDDPSYITRFDNLSFDRDDLYISDKGICANYYDWPDKFTEMGLWSTVAAFFRIKVNFLQYETFIKPTLSPDVNYPFYVEQSGPSGIKSGQFIL